MLNHFAYLILPTLVLIAACGGDDTDPPPPVEDGGMQGDSSVPMSCMADMDCDDGNPCNGVESCVLNMCGSGSVAADGTSCTIEDGSAICLGGFCVNSTCGDGYLDAARMEECDDGNTEPGDGCEPDCQLTCEVDPDCDDGDVCNGTETCDRSSNNCRLGTPATDGTPCGMDQACRSGMCVSVACGDMVVDMGEQCDDGNMVDGDGCDTDCTFSCTEAADCNDGSICTGMESCDIATHTCQPGMMLDCSPSDACHRLADPACDPMDGCQEELIDGDSDGFAPEGLTCTDPMMGGDCDDMRDDVYPGAAELCDGRDNDCDGMMDEGNPVWYPDCDKDGYAPMGSAGTISCMAPSGRPTGCSLPAVGIQWTTRAPTAGNRDCNDNRDDVNPSIAAYSTSPHNGSSYDWNCNGTTERRYAVSGADPEAVCLSSVFTRLCSGSAGWTGRGVPACGAEASYTYCLNGLRGCTRVTVDRTQPCR